MQIKTLLKYLSVSILAILLTFGCSKPQESVNTIIVGTMAGPDAELLKVAKDVAQKKYGLDIKIVEFSDYNLPNVALVDGSIDANIFQHQPYLDETIILKRYPLTSIGKTFVFPMAVYAKKLKNIHQVETGSTIAIPNDPSNEARALFLLQKAGLIKLKQGATTYASVHDIIENPSKLKIKTLDAAQLARVLPDVSFAVINSNYAIPAGLLPTRDAIYIEDLKSPYVNIIVVRTADQNKEKYKKLVEVMHSPEVAKAANTIFAGQAFPGWEKK